MSIRNVDRNVTKIFLSPFQPEKLASYKTFLWEYYGINIAVDPATCKLQINGMSLPDTAKLFAEYVLQQSRERIIVIRKTGRASICVRIIRPDTHGYSSMQAYNCYERLEPFAKQQPEILPESRQKSYESMREYKARMKAKRERETRK